jgi:Lecithin retinol acyltransferase
MEIEDAVYREARMSGRAIGSSYGLRPGDLALSSESEPPLGAHMVTPRRGYAHHGIYVGEGRVVQYGGLSRGLRRGPIEEVSLSQFAQGRPICQRPGESLWFDRDEVVRRARMRLGENRYNVLTNNCEHFCEWCVRGEHRSYQVDDIIVRWSRTWRRLAEVLGRSPFPGRRAADAH